MKETLDFLELDREQIEDAFLKNDFIGRTKSSYFAVIDKTVTDRAQVEEILEETNLLSGYQAVLFGEGIGEGADMDVAAVMRHPQMKIYALAVKKSLLEWTGSFHETLQEYNTYEFLCRAAAETTVYGISCSEDDTGDAGGSHTVEEKENCDRTNRVGADKDSLALIFAYITRLHMVRLQAQGILDDVFSRIIDYMAELGCGQEFSDVMGVMLDSFAEFEKLARNTAPYLIFVGDDTCYSVPKRFAAALSDELADLGQAVITTDGRHGEWNVGGGSNIAVPPVLKGVVGYQMEILERDIFRQMACPKYQFWFDNPIYFTDMFHDLPKEYYILSQDADYADYIKRYYGTEHAIQFPPAGEDAGYATNQDRPYDVVFIGSYRNQWDVDAFPEEERAFYEYMKCHPDVNFEEGYRQYLKEGTSADAVCDDDLMQDSLTDLRGQEPDDGIYGNDPMQDSMAELRHQEPDKGAYDNDPVREGLERVKNACRAVTSYYRDAVIRTLTAADIQVHVYGDTWQNFHPEREENLIRHPEVSVEESLEVLGHAKIGLNIMTWHKEGMTERIANIMLSGAVCLSDESGYLRRHYSDGEELLLFRLSELDALPQKALGLLQDEDRRRQIAARAYERAKEEHTWRKRTEEFLALK